MIKKIGYAFATVALAAGASIGGATAASAAHCTEGKSPGFSYLGGEVASGDRDAKDTKGASGCRAATGSPSDRAPGGKP